MTKEFVSECLKRMVLYNTTKNTSALKEWEDAIKRLQEIKEQEPYCGAVDNILNGGC